VLGLPPTQDNAEEEEEEECDDVEDEEDDQYNRFLARLCEVFPGNTLAHVSQLLLLLLLLLCL
jgi:hypothetical protein